MVWLLKRRGIKIFTHGLECGIETTVNQDDRHEYGGLSPATQDIYSQREGLQKNQSPNSG
jgi:hypothetical protein